MSLFVWPTDPTKIPPPNTDFKGTVRKNVIRTEMDSGVFRQRRRMLAGLRTFTCVWTLTDAQFALFQGVYKYKVTDGADWFTMSLPFGSGFKNYTVRFTENGYTHDYDDVMYWKVTGVLETQDSTSPLTEAETTALL